MVKIALRFSLENSQNLRDPRGIAPGVLPQYIACAPLDLGSPDEYVWDSHCKQLEDRGDGGRVLNQQVSILKLFLE